MRALLSAGSPPRQTSARDGPIRRVLPPIGRFALHFLEMCGVMCLGAVVLSVAFFGGAALLGYPDFAQQFPELSMLVIAINLSLPMAAWMRYMRMDWRPTVEMSGATMVVGILLIIAYWLDVVPKGSLIELQTSLACPIMLAAMLLRPRLYSERMAHHVRHQSHAA